MNMTERVNAAVATAFLLTMLVATVMVAGASELCGAGTSGKIDTTGDPQTVTITAPEGYLIDSYCVKAGTEAVTVDVNPDAESAVVSAPNGKAVSHYSFTLIREDTPSSTTAPSSTSTTSVVPPSTTTTEPNGTSTTDTTPSSTTTTLPPKNATDTPSIPNPSVQADTLPYTGSEGRTSGIIGGLLLGGGLGVILWERFGGGDRRDL